MIAKLESLEHASAFIRKCGMHVAEADNKVSGEMT